MMAIVSWILFGLVVGALASALGKLFAPREPVVSDRSEPSGRDPGGFITPAILGISGALLGGWLGQLLGVGAAATISIAGVVMAVLGAVIVLAIYNAMTSRRLRI